MASSIRATGQLSSQPYNLHAYNQVVQTTGQRVVICLFINLTEQTNYFFKSQVAHYTVGFRKRLGLATDDSNTSSLFYRNRISRVSESQKNCL
jgi:hypothetical protein